MIRRLFSPRGLLIAVVTGLVMVAPGTASADVTLQASNPPTGATVTTPLAALSLTFSGPIDGGQVNITLTGPDGAPVTLTGQPSTVDTTVTQPVPELANGAYTMTYEIVAGDGHAQSGTVAFTVALPAAPTTTVPPTTETETTAPDAETTTSQPGTAAGRDDGGGTVLWWVLAVTLLVAAIVVGIVLARRRSGTRSN